MVALVDDYVAVLGDQLVDIVLLDEALDHGDVEGAVGLAMATADPADLLFIDFEEHGKLGDPLFEQWLAVHQNQGVAPASCDQVGAKYGLANAGGSDKDARVVRQ